MVAVGDLLLLTDAAIMIWNAAWPGEAAQYTIMLVGSFSTESRMQGKRPCSGHWHVTLKKWVNPCDIMLYGFDACFSPEWGQYWEYSLGDVFFKVKDWHYSPWSNYPGIIELHDYINTAEMGMLTWDDLSAIALETPVSFFDERYPAHFSYKL